MEKFSALWKALPAEISCEEPYCTLKSVYELAEGDSLAQAMNLCEEMTDYFSDADISEDL